MPEWLLLYNPSSSTGSRTWRRARRIISSRGYSEVAHVNCVALCDLSSVQSVPERLVVLGGDGTINAAAQWLLEREGRCPLAIVPAGTGNNLARGLTLPLET